MPRCFLLFSSCIGKHKQRMVFNPLPFPINPRFLLLRMALLLGLTVYRGENLHRLPDFLCWELTEVLSVDFDMHPRFSH